MELNLLHKQIISEFSVDITALPADIQSKISALDALIIDAEKIPAEEVDKIAEAKKKIETISGKIGHAIKDILEENLPEDTGAAAVTPPAATTEEIQAPVIKEEEVQPPTPPVIAEVETETSQPRTLLQSRISRRSTPPTEE